MSALFFFHNYSFVSILLHCLCSIKKHKPGFCLSLPTVQIDPCIRGCCLANVVHPIRAYPNYHMHPIVQVLVHDGLSCKHLIPYSSTGLFCSIAYNPARHYLCLHDLDGCWCHIFLHDFHSEKHHWV